VAEEAVISQPVVFTPALKTVSVVKSESAIVNVLHVPGLSMSLKS